MAIKAAELFNPDPGQVRDLGGVSAADVFRIPLSRIRNMSAEAGQEDAALAEPLEDLDADTDKVSVPELFNRSPQVTQPSVLPSTTPAPAPQGDMPVPGGDLTSFVKEFEGFSPTAFDDYKQTSIGFGTVGRPGERITREEAEKRLAGELSSHRKRTEEAAARYGYEFTPNELDALTSFSYNIGSIDQLTDRGKRSKQQIAEAMLLYNKAGGKTLKGLERRRQAERALFLKGY